MSDKNTLHVGRPAGGQTGPRRRILVVEDEPGLIY